METNKKIQTKFNQVIYSIKQVKTLCKKAIEDHYQLSISNQPYNDEEAKEMINNWLKKHIK